MDEVWLPIPLLPGAMASSLGRVHLPGGHPTAGYKTQTSPNHVKLVSKTRRFGTLQIGRLVCEAFHGPAPDDKSMARHKDGNSLNNQPENLCWATRKEIFNSDVFKSYCRQRTGERNPVVKAEIARQARRQALLHKFTRERMEGPQA